MRTDHPLRTQAAAAFGAIRRDRGTALYIARTEGVSPYFDVHKEGDAFLLTPNAEGYALLAGWDALRSVPDDPALRRFDGRPCAGADTALLCACLKLLESPDPGTFAVCEHRVHSRAALLLRTGENEGGTLPLCKKLLRLCENASR